MADEETIVEEIPPRGILPPWAANLLLAAGSLLVAGVLGVALLAYFRPALFQTPTKDTRAPHPVYHHGLVPNQTSFVPGWVRYRTNSSGFRDDEIPYDKPSGELRVLMLGDSYTEGFNVPQEKTFSQVAERLLARKLGRPVQVINAGCVSHSPLLEFLLLKEEGWRYHPDLVVLNLDMSDVQDDFFYERSAKADEQGIPYKVDPFLIPSANQSWGAFGSGMPGDILNDRFFHLRPGADSSVRASWAPHFDRTFRYVMLAARLAEEKGARFLLTTYPYAQMVSPREWEEGRKAHGFGPGIHDTPFRPYLARMTALAGISFLDMTDGFRAASARGAYPLYLHQDGHFSVQGHHLAAELITRAILSRGLLPAPPAGGPR